MLARRLGTILPPLSHPEALEVTRIHSAAGECRSADSSCAARPFRAPHHTASTAALVGGGSGRPRPGEITLAHRGILFLDELGEFAPTALDALRQPLEERGGAHLAPGRLAHLPRRVPTGGVLQPVPVRLGRQRVPVQ